MGTRDNAVRDVTSQSYFLEVPKEPLRTKVIFALCGPSSKRVRLSEHRLVVLRITVLRFRFSQFALRNTWKTDRNSAQSRSERQITTLTTNVVRGTIKVEC